MQKKMITASGEKLRFPTSSLRSRTAAALSLKKTDISKILKYFNLQKWLENFKADVPNYNLTLNSTLQQQLYFNFHQTNIGTACFACDFHADT
jgi:hypothetical protein